MREVARQKVVSWELGSSDAVSYSMPVTQSTFGVSVGSAGDLHCGQLAGCLRGPAFGRCGGVLVVVCSFGCVCLWDGFRLSCVQIIKINKIK